MPCRLWAGMVSTRRRRRLLCRVGWVTACDMPKDTSVSRRSSMRERMGLVETRKEGAWQE